MKSFKQILWWLLGFYILMAVVYIAWTTIAYGEPEWVGSVALVLMAVFSLFIGFFLRLEHKPFEVHRLVEDRLDGEIADAETELGQFSPSSWWPVALAAVIGVALIGASIGWWIVFFASPLLILAIIGWSFEYYSGHLKH